jgi:hypothetical protein
MPCNALMLEFLKGVQDSKTKAEVEVESEETDCKRSSSTRDHNAGPALTTESSSSSGSHHGNRWFGTSNERFGMVSKGEDFSDDDEEDEMEVDGSLTADSSSLGVQSSLSTRTVSSIGLTNPNKQGRRGGFATAKASQKRPPASFVVWMKNQRLSSGISTPSDSSSGENDDDENARRLRRVLTTDLWSHHEEIVLAGLKDLVCMCPSSSSRLKEEEQSEEEREVDKIRHSGLGDDNALHEMVLMGGHLGVVCAMQAFPRSAPIQMHGLRLLLLLGMSFNRHWLNVLGQLGGIGVAVQALLSFPAARDLNSAPTSLSSSSSTTSSSSSCCRAMPRWYKAPVALHSRAYKLLSLLLSTRDNLVRFVRDPDAGWLQVRALLEREPYDPPARRWIGRLLQRLAAWEDEAEKDNDDDCSRGSGLGLASALCLSVSSLEVDCMSVRPSSDGSSIKSTVTESTVEESETSNPDDNDHDEEGSGSNADCSESVPTGGSDETRASAAAAAASTASLTTATSKPKKRVTFAPVPFDEWDYEGDDLSEISVDDADSASSSSDGSEPETSCPVEALFVQSAIHDALSHDDPSDALRTVRETLKRSRQEFAQTFLEVGGPLALTQCLGDRLEIKNVQLRGYDIMHQLLKLDGFADVLGDLDAVRIVLEGLRSHPQSETLAKDGCHALFELISRCDANVDRFLSLDGLIMVLSILTSFEGRPGVEHRACQVLAAFAPHGKPLLFELGGVSAVQRILERNSSPPSGSKTRDAAQQVLDCMLTV